MKNKCRLFTVIRHHDESGVSGTGPVMEGVVFECGRTVVLWKTENTTITVFDNFDEFLAVHIIPHPKNKSEIIWYSPKMIKREGGKRQSVH